ncbi:MAG: prepilin-type N-terminal cleavage/methylation domain-containing protein [Victivallaceae bacterium]
MPREKNFFTLIELLIVCAVLAILMAIAVPAYRSMIAGQKVASAAKVIGSQVAIARSTAVTRSKYVALLLPRGDKGSGLDNPGVGFSGTEHDAGADLNTVKYRGSILAFVEPVGDKFEFRTVVPGSKWEMLTPGVIAFVENNSTETSPNYASEVTFKSGDDEKLGKRLTKCTAVVFGSNGKLAGKHNLDIRVVPAYVDENTEKIKYETILDKSSESANYQKMINNGYALLINKYTGRSAYEVKYDNKK